MLENDKQRVAATAALLAEAQRPGVRVIRVRNALGSPLTLRRLLVDVRGASGELPAVEDPRLLVEAIAPSSLNEKRVMLVIEQAEALHPDLLRSLQAMSPYFNEIGRPSLRVVFVGRPTFRALLASEDLSELRAALAPQPDRASGVAAGPSPRTTVNPALPPLPFPLDGGRRWSWHPRSGRHALAAIATILVVAMGGYVGVRRFYDRAGAPNPLTAITQQPTPLPPAPAPATPPTRPPVGLLPDLQSKAPDTLDFDNFLRSGRNPVTLPEPERQAPADQFLTAQPRQRGSAAVPAPLIGPLSGVGLAGPGVPRVVIHVPTGSAPAEAIAGQLAAGLTGYSGTAETRHVPDTPNRPNIRYFYPEDEAVARQVASRMTAGGFDWALRDFTSYQPRPSRGTIEVWLPSQP